MAFFGSEVSTVENSATQSRIAVALVTGGAYHIGWVSTWNLYLAGIVALASHLNFRRARITI